MSTHGEEMSNLYRGSSIDESYHAWFNLAKQFQRRGLLGIDQSERVLPVAAMFVNEMSNIYRGHSIDDFAKFWFIWLSGFR